jgi:hypothetical protein
MPDVWHAKKTCPSMPIAQSALRLSDVSLGHPQAQAHGCADYCVVHSIDIDCPMKYLDVSGPDLSKGQ